MLHGVRAVAGLLASQGLTRAGVEADGGIHEQTIAMAVNAGAATAVAGSAIFDATRPVHACVTALRNAAVRTPDSRTTTTRGT
jgi:pentose-5-phosphate-3-epimerase